MNRQCENCVFGELCYEPIECENYFPVGDEAEDEFINYIIDEEMIEYREAWFDYISEYNED